MDETTKLILKNAAASVLRAALYALGTWLVSKGALSEGQNQAVQAHAPEIVAGCITFAAALGWSIWQKKHANDKVDAALVSPPVTREKFERSLDK
jgi:hypothetical protein